jgi:light-independent protochlorophyllide reductase subunit B
MQTAAITAATVHSEQTSAVNTPEIIVTSAWDAGAEKELKKIPFFVRGKARRNTEKYATERGISVITTETLYESKAYYSQS